MAWKSALPLLLSLPALSSAAAFTAFRDSQCSEPMEISSDGNIVPDSRLEITNSITDWSNSAGHWYDKMSYKNATLSGTITGTGSNNVYWKVDDPDPSCAFLMMKNEEQSWQVLNPLPGNLIIAAAAPGCYYSALDPDVGLIVSFCCGTGDCGKADLGARVIAKREEEPAKRESAVEKRVPASNAARAAETVQQRRRVMLHERDNAPECKVVGNVGSSYRTSGPQRAVTRPERCDTGPFTCSHTVDFNVEAATAVSNSESHSWTVTGGVSFSAEAGVSFIADVKSTTTLSASIAKSWGAKTGTTVTNSNTTVTGQNVVQQVGTKAFLSFTPIYDCWQADTSCGTDENGQEILVPSVDFCQPAISNGQMAGTYTMVYLL